MRVIRGPLRPGGATGAPGENRGRQAPAALWLSSLKTRWKRTLLPSSPADLCSSLFDTKICPAFHQYAPCVGSGARHWGRG